MLSGAALNAAGNPEGSMGIASGDADDDGDEDLFVTNIIGETFALYENDGKATFEDARSRWGLAQPTAAFTGFGTDWIDYDNDGGSICSPPTARVNVIESQRGQPLAVPDEEPAVPQWRHAALRRTSAPRRGRRSRSIEIGRGAAFGDVDNDGDTDIVVDEQQRPGAAVDQRGRCAAHTGLQIRLQQDGGNRDGLGALDRRRARQAADPVAAGQNRRQLSVGKRHAGALRAGQLRGGQR